MATTCTTVVHGEHQNLISGVLLYGGADGSPGRENDLVKIRNYDGDTVWVPTSKFGHDIWIGKLKDVTPEFPDEPDRKSARKAMEVDPQVDAIASTLQNMEIPATQPKLS